MIAQDEQLEADRLDAQALLAPFQVDTGVPYVAGPIVVATSGGTVIDNFRNSGVWGIPEPGMWFLMILGFGSVGVALRGRQRRIGTV